MLAGTIGVLTLAVLYAVFFLVPPRRRAGELCAHRILPHSMCLGFGDCILLCRLLGGALSEDARTSL